jgi:hypothetical protein
MCGQPGRNSWTAGAGRRDRLLARPRDPGSEERNPLRFETVSALL